MAEINLLPKGLGQSSSLAKALKHLQQVNTVGTVIFGLFGLVAAGVLILNVVSIDRLTLSLEELKSQVATRQTMEQQYSLLQNRLKAIRQVYLNNNLFADVHDFSLTYSELERWADVDSLKIGSEKIELGVSLRNSGDLKAFFEKAVALDYQKIVMDSLTYRLGGYEATFTLSNEDEK